MRIRNHTNPFTIRHRFEKLDIPTLFPNLDGHLCYEIGFGRGVFLRHYAKHHPNDKIVGIEVRKLITETLTKRLEQDPQPNIHIIHGNGEIGLEDLFENESLDKVFLFHPDPWFKKKHTKRRVINPTFLSTLYQKLKPTGKLYLTTDVAPLWEAMNETIKEDPRYQETTEPKFWETLYQTHWQLFSQKEKRPLFQIAYKKNKSN